MNVPLKWLSDYVKLPKKLSDLTDKLTSVGHMLDKTKTVAGDTVIDLELRGNRADMFGLIGTARDIAACFDVPLKLPPVAKLPAVDPTSPLIKADKSAQGLVTRYLALKLSVTVGPSPKWLSDRLQAYGLEPINNVVDITNFVMLETSHPLHAFDFAKISGGQLVLRRATSGERFNTIQQGTTVRLKPEDLVIADKSRVQCLTVIGGLDSKVTDSTTDIILETAVYNAATSRRTARRHKIFTEGGSRHEKFQDPVGLPFTLARAVFLLQQFAQAKIQGKLSNYYPRPSKPLKLAFPVSEIRRLGGISVPLTSIKTILKLLGFNVLSVSTDNLVVVVPSFRTDIACTADIVEEVLRIWGYDKIPATNLSGNLPAPQTYPSYALQEKVRTILTSLGLSEVITLSMSPSSTNSIKLVNPPDPDFAHLRTSLLPNLTSYSRRLLNRGVEHVSLFEIGKVFHHSTKVYLENLKVGLVLAGQDTSKNWLTTPKPLSIYQLKGILESLSNLLGVSHLDYVPSESNGIFLAEIDLDALLTKTPQFTNPYSIISVFPPITEDINLTFTKSYRDLDQDIRSLSPLITSVKLIDKYGDKLTLRLTFHDSARQLSTSDIVPIREKIMALD